MGLKCCVVGCSSTSDSHRLFMFPKNDELRNLWMSFLVPTTPRLLGLSKDQLITRRVCEKHFDKQQFGVEGRRLRLSYPCLISKKEIEHGVPLITSENIKRNEQEGGFNKTVFTDHNYCKFEIPFGQTGNVQPSGKVAPPGDVAAPIDLDLPGGVDSQINLDQDAGKIEESFNNFALFYDDDYHSAAVPDDGDVETPGVVDLPGGVDSQDNAEPEQVFSDDVVDDCDVTAISDDDDLSMYPDESQAEECAEQPNLSEVDLHDGFKCNYCSGDIKGYRYTCVQCPDYDLCGACEARGAHCMHYVLRIPKPRPFAEVQSVLNKIRSQLLCGVDKQPDILREDGEIKEEVKEEVDPDPNLDPCLNLDPDPLRIDDAPPTTHEDELHIETEDNECTVPEVSAETETLNNLYYLMNSGTSDPSPSSLYANTEIIDGNTVLTVAMEGGTSSPATCVPIQARAKRKNRDDIDVSNLAIAALNDAKKMKVLVEPLPLDVLRSFASSSLVQREKSKTRHKRGVVQYNISRVAATSYSESIVSRENDDAIYLEQDILELQ